MDFFCRIGIFFFFFSPVVFLFCFFWYASVQSLQIQPGFSLLPLSSLSSYSHLCLLLFSLKLFFFILHPPPSPMTSFSLSLHLPLLSSPPLPGAMWHTQGMMRMRMMMVQMMMKLTLSKFFRSLRTGSRPPTVSLFLPPFLPSS